MPRLNPKPSIWDKTDYKAVDQDIRNTNAAVNGLLGNESGSVMDGTADINQNAGVAGYAADAMALMLPLAKAGFLGGGLLGSVSKPVGTSAITKAMTDVDKAAAAVDVGTLEANHMKTWGKSGNNSLLFGGVDVDHSTKRLNEGVFPSEIADIAFRATQKNAHATVTGKNDLLLTSPIPMKFEDSPIFKPQAIIRQADDGMHLYGVIPKGWKGRKK